MTDFERLKKQIDELHTLARLQRSLRLLLRAYWLATAGILSGFAVNSLWGWLPNPASWFLIGLALALIPIAALLFSLLPRSKWVWKLDRRLDLHEQVSTAWEAARKDQGGLMTQALIQDVLRILPQVRARMLKRGWFLERDIVPVLIAALLSIVVLTSMLIQPFADLIGNPPAALAVPQAQVQPQQEPPAGQLPEEEEAGSPAPGASQEGSDGDSQPGNEPSGGQAGDQQPDENGDPGSDPGAAAGALGELGAELSEQAGTYELGQALEEMDLDRAAEELQDLAGQLDELSPESRENLAEALQEAAEALENAGEQPLADSLADAAEALQEEGQEPGDAAGEALDEVAGDLRELGDPLGGSGVAGAGSGDENSSTNRRAGPVDRLQGEGGDLELPLDESAQSGLLSQAPAGAEGEGTLSGSMDSTSASGDEAVESPLVPNFFLWKWRDIVGEYFRR